MATNSDGLFDSVVSVVAFAAFDDIVVYKTMMVKQIQKKLTTLTMTKMMMKKMRRA